MENSNISGITFSESKMPGFNHNLTRDVNINISDNPIYCGCAIFKFLKYLKGEVNSHLKDVVGFKNVNNLICEGPERYKGETLIKLVFNKTYRQIF